MLGREEKFWMRCEIKVSHLTEPFITWKWVIITEIGLIFFFFFYWKWLESYLNCLQSHSGMGEGNLTCWKGSGRRKNTAASCLYSLYSTLSIDWLHIYWFSCSHKMTNSNPHYIPNVRVKRWRIPGRAWRDRFLSSHRQRCGSSHPCLVHLCMEHRLSSLFSSSPSLNSLIFFFYFPAHPMFSNFFCRIILTIT